MSDVPRRRDRSAARGCEYRVEPSRPTEGTPGLALKTPCLPSGAGKSIVGGKKPDGDKVGPSPTRRAPFQPLVAGLPRAEHPSIPRMVSLAPALRWLSSLTLLLGSQDSQVISYSADKVIGNGSFGVVFKATKVDTGEIVAIKKVLQDKRFKVVDASTPCADSAAALP